MEMEKQTFGKCLLGQAEAVGHRMDSDLQALSRVSLPHLPILLQNTQRNTQKNYTKRDFKTQIITVV